MNQTTPSRASLADVIVAVSQANLTAVQRRDQTSAVRTVARLLGAPPEAIPVNIQLLRNRLEELSPGVAGVSPGRWANIRSLFGRALSQIRPIQPSRSVVPISQGWMSLLAGLDRNRATRLQPLLRHLSRLGIEPQTIGRADLEGYRDALLQERLRRRPEKVWENLLWAWNACAREVPGWPGVQLERPSRRVTYVLPWSHFPAELKTDVDAFLAWRGGVDLSQNGPLRPARPSTLKMRQYQLRIAASALAHLGEPAGELRSLKDIVTAEKVRRILDFLLDRHKRKLLPHIGYIAAFLKYIAEKYLELDELSVLQMKRMTSKLLPGRRGLTSRNRERLRPFDDPQTVQAYLDLPERIRTDLERDKRAAGPKARLAQAAAAIAIQQAVPLRISNLASIEFEKHLVERSGRVYLIFREQETKNGEPIELELPEHALAILAWYVRDHRPVLLTTDSKALFPGEGGRTKSAQLLGSQISKVIHQYLGLTMHAHLFRHAAAKIYLDRRPGGYEVVRQVLGHRSIQTTTAIYAGAELRSASAHFAAVINERRTGLRQSRRRDKRSTGWITQAIHP